MFWGKLQLDATKTSELPRCKGLFTSNVSVDTWEWVLWEPFLVSTLASILTLGENGISINQCGFSKASTLMLSVNTA